MKNDEMLKLAEAHLGQGGGVFRRYCGMSGGAWCCAFVTYMFHEGDASPLFYGGKKVVYCPTAIQWCKAHLAQIPIYLALPMDIVFFDWNNNNVPDHIGFAVERLNDQKIHTIEGNTSGGIVAEKTRPNKYILGCFRPHYKAKYDASKALVIDGCFGNNSIACLQKALGIKVDGILGKDTVKALQKKAGAVTGKNLACDGAWGVKTSKAVQKMVGFKGEDIDGAFGVKSVKALQKWINKQNKKAEPKKTEPKKETPKAEPKTQGDKIAESAKSYVGKVKYVKGGTSLKTGCDCTGFVQAIHRLHGIVLKVNESWGKSVGKDTSKAKAGDVIYYYMNGSLHHMGIYIGNGKIVHNSTSHKDWHKDVCISSVKLSGMKVGDIRRCWK